MQSIITSWPISEVVNIVLLAIAVVGFFISRAKDRRAREREAVVRATEDFKQHQQTRDTVKDLAHGFDKRIQQTEGSSARNQASIDRHEVRINQLEKDVVGLQANARRAN